MLHQLYAPVRFRFNKWKFKPISSIHSRRENLLGWDSRIYRISVAPIGGLNKATPMKNRKKTAGEKRVMELAQVRSRDKGSDRKLGELTLVRSWIEKRNFDWDSDMQGACWIEYRYMTPLERTELFAKEYHKSYLKAYKKANPGEDATKKNPLDPRFVANDIGVMNSLWKARIEADRAGVPYDVYLDVVMEGHLVNDKWKRPPRPNQLYGNLDLPRLRGMPTPEMIAERLCATGWDYRFFASSYQGDEDQDIAIRMLQLAVTSSTDPIATLSRFLCERKAITEQKALELFGTDLVSSARALSKEVPVTQPAPYGRYIPPCVGYPNVDDCSACEVCPISRQCLKFSGMVRDEMIRVFGTDDPRREWKKLKNRERQRRYRERQKTEDLSDLLDEQDLPDSPPNDPAA